MKPANSDEELNKGRVALWLDPEDVAFLADEWRKIPDNAPDQTRETWSRIAFRASSLLHKSGLKYEPKFPNDDEKYIV